MGNERSGINVSKYHGEGKRRWSGAFCITAKHGIAAEWMGLCSSAVSHNKDEKVVLDHCCCFWERASVLNAESHVPDMMARLLC